VSHTVPSPYAVLTVLHSLEAFSRICVNGIILDPETPTSSISIPGMFRYLWKSVFDPKPGPRFHGMVKGIVKPFALVKEQVPATTNATAPGEKLGIGHGHQTSLAFSHRPIPFVTAIQQQRSLSKRGVPYLRHSWSRIDFVTIVGFWIAFALSMTGTDRVITIDPVAGPTLVRHIGVFKALSVLRCARLLAVTNGTTVSVSLGISLPRW
jgi:voltage-dependent calcium channel